jgi:hypothetical protein
MHLTDVVRIWWGRASLADPKGAPSNIVTLEPMLQLLLNHLKPP